MSNNRQNRKNTSGINGGFSFLPRITNRSSDEFLQDIIKIQENQYTPINHVPTVFGRRIDLLAMYNAVAQRGGLKKMITELSWEGVMKDLKIPVKCANACVALRSIYQRYLEQFERLQRNKATISDIEEELQIESENRYKNVTPKSTLTHFNINPNNMVYRSDMHQINTHKRQEIGLSCDLSDVFEYRNLEMSLKSGLVNEIEFSLNTCLLMSYQNEGIQLWRNPKILDLMLSTVSMLDSDLCYNQFFTDLSARRFLRFWNNTVTDDKGRKFLNPDVFNKDETEISLLDALSQIFTVNEELTIYDKEGQRIQLVATILRNLAFDNLNGRLLTQCNQCIRFVLLCYYASHFALRQLGLEILSMLKFPVCGILVDTFTHLLVDLIKSEDRVDRLRGLEMISRLCDPTVCNENIDFFVSLPKTFFMSLISTLIVHDLHLLVLALEAVYGLSEVDPILCCKLIDCSSETLITLYTLLSLEAQVMGTQSLVRIRVMQGPSVIASTSNNAISNIRSNSSLPYHNQLATSLMPPPPAPLHKIPISVMPVSHGTSLKPQNCMTTELTNSIKSVTNQRIYPLITKSNPIFCQYPNSVTTHVSEMIQSVSISNQINEPVISTLSVTKPTLLSNINLHVQNHLSQKIITSNASNLVSTTNSSPIKSTLTNYAPIIKTTCISTPLPTLLLESSSNVELNDRKNHETLGSSSNTIQVSGKLTSTSLTNINLSNNNIPEIVSQSKDIGITPSHLNKQEFVKTWLLGNYVEFPQCTVPLFLIYKQLQIAVQNHFRDSEMVSAEEFHKLVRLLFPQVQLVQLYTPGGAVEIHYYNLKSSPKTTALESLLESHKLKPLLNNPQEIICNIKNNVPHLNNAQSNCLTESINDQHKSSKRHSNEIINGISSELSESNNIPKKKPKYNDEYKGHNVSNSVSFQKVKFSGNELKENHLKNSLNGIAIPHTVQNDVNCHMLSDQKINDSSLNGSSTDVLKHSDFKMKVISSSDSSQIYCESPVNGTDLQITVSANLSFQKQTPNVISNGNQIICSSESINTVFQDDASTSDSNQQKRTYKKINSNQLGRTRSRFRNNGSGAKGKQRNYSNQRPYNLSYLYICEWDNCLQSFDKPQKVYGHVYTNHFMTLRTEVESLCLWSGCEDKTHRTPLPLLNHVNEQHCNNVALESARQMRLANEKDKTISSVPETTLKSNTDNILTPKFVNINSNNFQPKLSFSVNESSASSVAYQLVTQPSISPISNVHNSKTSSVSSLPMIPPLIKESPIAMLEPHLTGSPLVAAIAPALSTPINPLLLTSQKEISASPINHCNITSSIEHRPNSQIMSKLKSPSCSSAFLSSTTSVISQNSCDSLSNIESGQYTKQSIKEGPVTKHIRFLSALILRNLCQNSNVARRFVSVRHQQIFEMSISGCESSMALSECLLFSSNEIPLTGKMMSGQ